MAIVIFLIKLASPFLRAPSFSKSNIRSFSEARFKKKMAFAVLAKPAFPQKRHSQSQKRANPAEKQHSKAGDSSIAEKTPGCRNPSPIEFQLPGALLLPRNNNHGPGVLVVR